MTREIGANGWPIRSSQPERVCQRARELLDEGNYLYLKRLIDDADDVEKQALCTMRIRDGRTLLHAVVRKDHEELVEKILALKLADLEAVSDIGWTPLRMAVARGNKDIVNALLDAGANFRDRFGAEQVSISHTALSSGVAWIVKELWARGERLRPDEDNGNGYSALESAVALDDVEIFNLFLSAGDLGAAPIESLAAIFDAQAQRILGRCFDIPVFAEILAASPLDGRIDAKMLGRERELVNAWRTEREVLGAVCANGGEVESTRSRGRSSLAL